MLADKSEGECQFCNDQSIRTPGQHAWLILPNMPCVMLKYFLFGEKFYIYFTFLNILILQVIDFQFDLQLPTTPHHVSFSKNYPSPSLFSPEESPTIPRHDRKQGVRGQQGDSQVRGQQGDSQATPVRFPFTTQGKQHAWK